MSDYTPTAAEMRVEIAGPRQEGESFQEYLARIAEAQEAFDRLLAEVRREAAEKAWDEGWNEGVDWDVHALMRNPQPNPYRKAVGS